MNLVDLDHTSCAMTATQFVLRINKVCFGKMTQS